MSIEAGKIVKGKMSPRLFQPDNRQFQGLEPKGQGTGSRMQGKSSHVQGKSSHVQATDLGNKGMAPADVEAPIRLKPEGDLAPEVQNLYATAMSHFMENPDYAAQAQEHFKALSDARPVEALPPAPAVESIPENQRINKQAMYARDFNEQHVPTMNDDNRLQFRNAAGEVDQDLMSVGMLEELLATELKNPSGGGIDTADRESKQRIYKGLNNPAPVTITESTFANQQPPAPRDIQAELDEEEEKPPLPEEELLGILESILLGGAPVYATTIGQTHVKLKVPFGWEQTMIIKTFEEDNYQTNAAVQSRLSLLNLAASLVQLGDKEFEIIPQYAKVSDALADYRDRVTFLESQPTLLLDLMLLKLGTFIKAQIYIVQNNEKLLALFK